MIARSLYTRRPMAPVGVDVGWRGAPAMGNCIARMDASRARVCISFVVSRTIRIWLKFWGWFMEMPMSARDFIVASSDGSSRRRDWMAWRARDGGFYCSDGFVAGACVLFVRCGVIDSYKAQVLGLVYGNAADR